MKVQMLWENKLVAVATSPHSLPKEEQASKMPQVSILKDRYSTWIMDTIFKLDNLTNNK